MFPQTVRIVQLARQQRLLLILVRVKRRDPLLGRSILFISEAKLLQFILQTVPRHQQACPVADHQVVGCDLHAGQAERLDLLPKVLRVQGYAVAQNVDDAVPKDT